MCKRLNIIYNRTPAFAVIGHQQIKNSIFSVRDDIT